ncbi:AUGMIN subunit 5-like isoform X2 [Durio zibethinus]|uniref:AUGMIN subunit 5-like isoform X2 n=1 Tax=Durio zibethinus TaxID=66656 RepID=A0A6P6B3V1_DURZI|nr:AUGMIN subunit 5-like isoform X2 [Durio zibethinus]
MQSAIVQQEAILEWLQKEMGYRPLGPYNSSSKSNLPSIDSLSKICRGNMLPIWHFLLTRVKSEKTVQNIRKNITVHGGTSTSGGGGEARGGNSESGGNSGKEEGKSKGGWRRKKKVVGEGGREGSGAAEIREAAIREREAAAKEVERLRNIVRRQRKDLKARMLEISREEAERKRMLDERANCRHKQVMLEAYDQQCDEAAKIFAEYHKRLNQYVNQARDAQRSSIDSSIEVVNNFSANSEKEAVYSSVKGTKAADDVILIETTCERNICKACESLAERMIEKVCNSFPAYEGNGIHLSPQSEATKLGFDFDGDIPDEVRSNIVNCLKSPPQLLQAITTYTSRLKTLVSREIEKVDVRADAETLRYKYENNRVMDVSSPDVSSPLNYQLYGNGKVGMDVPSRGTQNQLLERQKAHVQQFLGTEEALNKAAEAKDLCQKLIKRLEGDSDVVPSHSLVGAAMQNVGSLRHFELEVLAKEREAAGLRASLNTLMSEIQRLNKLCAERKEAEDSLRKKWKKIEEFDSRRSELETIYTALLKANMDAAAFWNQQPLAAREYASSTIIPACNIVADISNSAKDFIDKDVSAFYRSPDNTLYMLPSSPQSLLESMGANGSTGPEAVAAAEKHAALLTARAGARDPSAIPSICRVSAALQYPAEGSDAGLASVLESLDFCLKLRGSEASVLEELAKAINLVHIRQDLVESGHSLLNLAYHAQQEYARTTNYCLNLAAEQEKIVIEKWLPELKTAVLNAQKCLEDCKYVSGLLDEWWEQPASTVLEWVTVDGQNIAAWHTHVKQLLAFYDKEVL